MGAGLVAGGLVAAPGPRLSSETETCFVRAAAKDCTPEQPEMPRFDDQGLLGLAAIAVAEIL